jgi:hypothetical protein
VVSQNIQKKTHSGNVPPERVTMKMKKEYLILAAVIIGLSIYLFARKTDRALYELPQLPEISGKKISKIEISGPEGTAVLNRADEDWSIGPQEYPAAKNKVQQMIDTIEGLKLTALISEAKDYIRYELSDDKKISVKAWAGDSLSREFEVGKAASSFRHTFVKLAGDPKVYHARDNFRNKFDQSVNDLRDKSVLSFAVNDIQEFSLAKGSESLTFGRKEASPEKKSESETTEKSQPPKKDEKVWQTADGRKADQAKLDRLLSTLAQLNCEEYIDDRKKEDFSEPVFTIQAKGTQEYSLSIFAKLKEDADNYPAISSQSEYVFLLEGWKADSLMPKFDEIVEKAKEEDTDKSN